MIEAVSLYGSANAGVRARLQGFLERLEIDYRLHSYFDDNAAGLDEFIRNPTRAMASEWRLRRLAGQRPSRVIISREASPLSKGGIEQRLLQAAGHGIYDLDDALHHDVRTPWFETFFSKLQKAERSVECADAVVTGNDFLADWASRRNPNVHVIPTCIEPSEYVQKSDYSLNDPPRFLWLGTRSGEEYLRILGPALSRLNREFGVTLTIIGDAEPRLGPMEEFISRIPWRLDVALERIASFDLGVMPLADSPYERGKCAYKLLEYGAARLPVVASPVGVNGAILAEAGCAAPRGIVEWYEALREVIVTSPGVRSSRAGALHDVVGSDFSFDRWVPVWRTLLI